MFAKTHTAITNRVKIHTKADTLLNLRMEKLRIYSELKELAVFEVVVISHIMELTMEIERRTLK
jgi:hypothetical protein